MTTNIEQAICFSSNYISALWLRNAADYYIANRTIVVNLGQDKACISALPSKYLLPRTSAILNEVSIKSADSLLLITIYNSTNIGGIVLDEDWHQLGELTDFPLDVPLWKSPQYDLGIVQFDPYVVTGMSDEIQPSRLKKYQVKVNLWYSPALTNAAIHHKHEEPDFLEVHTQIYGHGRMQKFHANDFTTLYQDDLMSPGMTHLPYANVDEEKRFVYPWNQYYADNDCIWMASEFHQIS